MDFGIGFEPWGGGVPYQGVICFVRCQKKSNIFEYLNKVFALRALIICPLLCLRDAITSKCVDGTGFKSRYSQEIFPFSKMSRPVGPTQPPNQWVRGFFFGDGVAGA